MPTLTERINTAVSALETGVTNLTTAIATCLGYRNEAETFANSAAGGAGAWTEKSSSFAAAANGRYIATATLTVTDPTGVQGIAFQVFVRAGTATVGGVAYSSGNIIVRSFNSAAWTSEVYQNKTLADAAYDIATSSTQQNALATREARSYDAFGLLINKGLRASFSGLALAANSLYYATDNQNFYRGDGSTVGGTSDTLGLTQSQLQRFNFIIPRFRKYGLKFNNAIINGAGSIPAVKFTGNSIGEGTGSSGGNGMVAKIGERLYAATNIGSASAWRPYNACVGGSNICLSAVYLSDNSDTTYQLRQTGVMYNSSFDVGAIIHLRNDVSQLTLAQYASVLNTVLISLRAKGVEPLVYIDPPKIDYSTGAILDTQANFGDWADIARRLAAAHGASVVDAHAYFTYLYNSGISLIPFYISDGIHPSNAGHKILGYLGAECLLSAGRGSQGFENGGVGDYRTACTSTYVAASTTGSLSTVSWSTATSARRNQTGEGAYQGYVLASGQTVYFSCPYGAKAVIIHALSSSSNTGTITAAFFPNTPASGLSCNDGSGANREITHLVAFSNNNNLMIPDRIQLTAAGGQIIILGVTWLHPTPTNHANGKFPGAIETGTWATVSKSSSIYGITGASFRESSTVGNTFKIRWKGTNLNFRAWRGTDAGKITYSTDGGASVTEDLYSTLNEFLALRVSYATTGVDHPLGEHETTFTVATKNASSSANKVAFGLICASSGAQVPNPVESLASFVSQIGTNDIENTTAGGGVILTAPDGTRYKLTTSNAGAAVLTAV